MAKQPETVIVLETPDPMELAMGRQLLEAAGIPCASRDANAAGAMAVVLGESFGGVRLLEVPVEFAQSALDVLAAAWGEPDAPASDAGDD